MSKFSLAQRKTLVSKFNSHQVSMREFCREHNISRTTIYKWRKKFKSSLDHPTSTPTSTDLDDSFIPLEISPLEAIDYKSESQPLSISSRFKLYKSDLIIEFYSGCSITELDAVIAILGGKDATK